MLQSPPSTSGARPPARSRSMRSARRRACSMMATWLRSEPGVASSAYLPGSTTPRSSAPSSARRRCRPASRSASGAFAQPGTLVGAGGRRPRLDGADSRPIIMPENYQIKLHGTGPNLPTGPVIRGNGGPVLLLPHVGGPACCCFFLRRGPGTGQFLAADPDGGQCDEQGEQRDSRRDQEPSGESGGQGVHGQLGWGCGRLAAGRDGRGGVPEVVGRGGPGDRAQRGQPDRAADLLAGVEQAGGDTGVLFGHVVQGD